MKISAKEVKTTLITPNSEAELYLESEPKRPLIGSSIASIQKSAAPEMLLALMDGAYTGSTIGMEVQILNLKIAIQSHLIQYFLNFLKILNLKLLIGSSIGSLKTKEQETSLASHHFLSGIRTELWANSSNTLPQDQTGDAARSGNISRQQKRVQAAAATTSIYQKSFVYPSPSSSLTWSSGHPLPPNQSAPGTGMNNAASSSEIDNSIPNNPATYSSFQLPVQAQGLSPNPEDAWATNLQFSVTQLEAQKRIIQNQIEVLQDQLQLIQKPATEKISVVESSTSTSSWEIAKGRPFHHHLC